MTPKARKQVCPRCGKTFRLPPERRGTPYTKFCSAACATAQKVQRAELRASRLEQGFVELLRDAGLMGVEQYPFGPYVIDLAFPQVSLLVEVDGEAYHTSPRAQARDDRKDALAAAEGWRVVRVPQFMVQQHPQEAVRAVVEAYLHCAGREGLT